MATKNIAVPLDPEETAQIKTGDKVQFDIFGRVLSVKNNTATIAAETIELVDVDDNAPTELKG